MEAKLRGGRGESIQVLARGAGTPTPPPKDTLIWLIGRYKDSTAWRRFAPSTRAARSAIYRRAIETLGDVPLPQITKRTIRAEIDKRRETPFAADEYLKSTRGLFKWAVEAGLVQHDPTEGIRGIGQRSTGFRVWTEEEITRFEAHWPIERASASLSAYCSSRGFAGAMRRASASSTSRME